MSVTKPDTTSTCPGRRTASCAMASTALCTQPLVGRTGKKEDRHRHQGAQQQGDHKGGHQTERTEDPQVLNDRHRCTGEREESHRRREGVEQAGPDHCAHPRLDPLERGELSGVAATWTNM